MEGELITQDGEVLEGGLTVIEVGALAEMSKAEITAQVETARRFPRSITKASRNINSLATLDEQAAQECIYALPRGGKPIRGPSIRLAEIVAQQWGNNRVATRVIETNRTEKVIVAEAVFHDLETNAAIKATVRRRIVDSKGRLFNDDMIVVTGNAASSIARRNAILAGVPKGIWRKAYEAAESVVKGDVKTLAERRSRAIASFGTWGVKPDQVFVALGVAGEDEVTLEHLPTLFGMFQAIKNGEETVESLFTNRSAQAGKVFDKVADPLNDGDKDGSGKPAAGPAGQGAKGPAAAKQDPAAPSFGENGQAAGEGAGTKPQAGPAPGSASQARGHTAEFAEADRVVDGAGKVLKDKNAPHEPDDAQAQWQRVEEARAAGEEAGRRQSGRRSPPAELNAEGREDEQDAWYEGFDRVRSGGGEG